MLPLHSSLLTQVVLFWNDLKRSPGHPHPSTQTAIQKSFSSPQTGAHDEWQSLKTRSPSHLFFIGVAVLTPMLPEEKFEKDHEIVSSHFHNTILIKQECKNYKKCT